MHPDRRLSLYLRAAFRAVSREREMKSPIVGYWISGTGKLSGAYHHPSLIERLIGLLFDRTWQPCPKEKPHG